MTAANMPTEEGLVACEICLREVPVSEAQCPEVVEYVVYFCGTDCYTKWVGQGAETKPEPGAPPPAGS